MRVVIQRVTSSILSIDGNEHSRIGAGLLILLSIEEADSDADTQWLTGKITGLRIFNDGEGVMNLDIKNVNGEVMVVSQFTLHASTRKGNRPSYIKAARPEIARPIYERFIEAIEKDLGRRVATGEFGANMQIELINDGPVTIIIDSKIKE